MAIGNENAILEVEVDAGAFDRGMERIDARARKTEQAMLASQRQQAEAAEAAATRREKAEDRAHKKALLAIGVGVAAWKKYLDFIASGTGETAKALQRVGARMEEFGQQIATVAGESAGLRGIATVLDEITSSASASAVGVSALGHAVALAAGPAVHLLGVLNDLREGPAGVRRRALAAAALEGEQQAEIDSAGARQRRLGAADAAEIMRQVNAGVTVPAPPPSVTGAAWDARHGGGGGGGGGGMSPEEKQRLLQAQAERFAEEKAQRERNLMEIARLETDAAKNLNAQLDQINSERYERERGNIEAQTAMRLEGEQRIVDEKRRQTDEFEAMEKAKVQAIQGTTQAMIQSTIATIAQGAAQGASAKQIAKRIAIASGWHALEEAAAGVGALAITWGVPNPASTGHFISAAMYGGLAAAAGGVSAALPGGRGGGGGGGQVGPPRDMVAPRGSGGGGGGTTINATIVLNAAGELVDDSTLRRMGRAIEEIERRGYAGGRR